MKKKGFILLFLILALGFPMRVFAEKINNTNNNNTSNSNNNIEDSDFTKIFELVEREFGRTISPLEAEKITPKLDNYKETDDQITIYVFRGQNCQYCQKFLNYVNRLVRKPKSVI